MMADGVRPIRIINDDGEIIEKALT